MQWAADGALLMGSSPLACQHQKQEAILERIVHLVVIFFFRHATGARAPANRSVCMGRVQHRKPALVRLAQEGSPTALLYSKFKTRSPLCKETDHDLGEKGDYIAIYPLKMTA